MNFLAGSKSTPSHSQSGRQQGCVAHLWVRSWSNRGQKIQHRKHSTRVNNNRVRALHGCRSRLQFHIRYVFLRANRRCWNRMICMPAGKKTTHHYNPQLLQSLLSFGGFFLLVWVFCFVVFLTAAVKSNCTWMLPVLLSLPQVKIPSTFLKPIDAFSLQTTQKGLNFLRAL